MESVKKESRKVWKNCQGNCQEKIVHTKFPWQFSWQFLLNKFLSQQFFPTFYEVAVAIFLNFFLPFHGTFLTIFHTKIFSEKKSDKILALALFFSLPRQWEPALKLCFHAIENSVIENRDFDKFTRFRVI